MNFIQRSNKIHLFKYDYSKSIYTKRSNLITIICPTHGEFKQEAGSHLNGRGCKKCGLEKLATISTNNKNSLADIVVRARKTHHNKYDYSKAVYKGYNKPFIIICCIHGEFKQTPANHISNRAGCPKCAIITRNKNLKKSFENFVYEAKTIHNNKYTYKQVQEYKGSRTAVLAICPTHGEFIIGQRAHLNNRGCCKCGIESASKKLIIPFDEFLKRTEELYGSRYKYLRDSYTSIKGTINVICPAHGQFVVRVQSHLSGSKCPQCSLNLFESSVADFLTELDIKFELFNRKILDGKELDIVVGNLAIECHGTYWHSYNKLESRNEKYRHYEKHDECIKKHIRLLQIFEHEWKYKQPIVKSIIKSAVGKVEKIYARKCSIVDIKTAYKFLNINHLQGYRHANITYGLAYNDQIVAVMSFTKHKVYQWEIIRYANTINACVVGGMSKLLSHFVKRNGGSIISYADRRFFTGKSYENAGFILDGVTKPNYKYVLGLETWSRQAFQKHKLAKKLKKFDQKLTEAQNMFANGYRRLWDAGNYRYIRQI